MIGLFRRAGATGHVFYLEGGKTRDKGLAYSGLYGFGTTIAVVPTTSQVLDFQVEAYTKDNQTVRVVGNVKILLSPTAAVSKIDFTVDPKNGSPRSNWPQALQALVIERVNAPTHAAIGGLNVVEARKAQAEVELAIQSALEGAVILAEKGIAIESCSVVRILPVDAELEKALGAKEREGVLTTADAARHERRMQGVDNEKAIQKAEAATELELEQGRAKLLETKGVNDKQAATDEAAATALRLEPFQKVGPGNALAAALMAFAEGGNVGTLVIGPELLGAMAAQ